MRKPRILFMGTPDFAVPALAALVRHGYPLSGVVTQPDRPRGRGLAAAPPPLKVAAQDLNLTVLQPEKIRHPDFLALFRELAPEIVVVAAFGQILPPEIIHGPQGGCLNIHPSLLPKYRGAAPIPWALIRGEETTGITIMRMDEGVDSGDILLQEETPILPGENCGELQDRLARRGAELLLTALAGQEAGTLLARPQDHRLASFAPRLQREDGRIRWEADAGAIVSLIRGLSPAPGAFTRLRGRQLKVHAAAADAAGACAAPGTVVGEGREGLRIAAGDGSVWLKEVQWEGKKRLPVHDFLRGMRIAPGEVLGRG
jgi:methionyl-tRNA formyltransferase